MCENVAALMFEAQFVYIAVYGNGFGRLPLHFFFYFLVLISIKYFSCLGGQHISLAALFVSVQNLLCTVLQITGFLFVHCSYSDIFDKVIKNSLLNAK